MTMGMFEIIPAIRMTAVEKDGETVWEMAKPCECGEIVGFIAPDGTQVCAGCGRPIIEEKPIKKEENANENENG